MLNKFFGGLIRACVENSKGKGRLMEDKDRHYLFGLVAHFLLEGLKDNMGNIEARDSIPIGLGLGQLPPAEGPAAANFVVDDYLLSEKLLQRELLTPRLAVRLSSRVKTDHVGY